MKNTLLILTACAMGSLTLLAQDNAPKQTSPVVLPSDTQPGFEPGGRRHHPPIPLIFQVLDTNHDGYIDAAELANAPAALKALDKNGDGRISLEEALGPRPHGMRPERPPGDGGIPPEENRGPGSLEQGEKPANPPQD
jgi:hypothetical protein